MLQRTAFPGVEKKTYVGFPKWEKGTHVCRNGTKQLFWGLFQEALSEFLGFFSASWADGQPE
jgi:hypothetical protein